MALSALQTLVHSNGVILQDAKQKIKQTDFFPASKGLEVHDETLC